METRRVGDFVSYKQRHEALFYPGSGPRRVIPYVLLVWIDFDGAVTMARSLLLEKPRQS